MTLQRSITFVEYREEKNPCDLCILDGKRKMSEFFCLDCENNLCDKCFSRHDTKANFNEHLAFNLHENNCVPYCRDHNKPIRCYCDTCGLLVCGNHANKECRMISIHQALMKLLNILEQMTDTMKTHRQTLASTKYEMEKLLTQQEKLIRGMKTASRESGLSAIITQGQNKVISDQEALCVQYSDQIDDFGKKMYDLNHLIVEADKVLSVSSRFSVQLLEIAKKLCNEIECKLSEFERHQDKAFDHLKHRAVYTLDSSSARCGDMAWLGQEQSTLSQISINSSSKSQERFQQNFGDGASNAHQSTNRGITRETSQHTLEEEMYPTSLSPSKIGSLESSFSDFSLLKDCSSHDGHVFTISQGHRRGLLKAPIDIIFDTQDRLAVAEYENERIQVFDSKGESLYRMGSDEIIPQGIAITSDDRFVITDKNSKSVILFTKEKEMVTLGDGLFTNPHGITVNSKDQLIVTDIDKYQVIIITLDDQFITKFGCYGEQPHQFGWPGYLTVDLNDNILISDSDHACVKRFSSEGDFIDCIGDKTGHLRCPKGVAVTKSGNILVADRLGNSVCMFSSNGMFIHHVISGQVVAEPRALAVSKEGLLAVTEYLTDQCKVFQMFT